MLKEKLSALIVLIITVSLIWWLKDAAAAKIAMLKLSIPVLFIWFGNFIADHLGDSVIAFLTLGFVTGLEGHHIKIFGWFWLTVHILFWIFAPEVARNLPASV